MTKRTHIILLTVTTEKDIDGLKEKIEDRTWRMDGVTHTEAAVIKVLTGDEVDHIDEGINVTVEIDKDHSVTRVLQHV